MFSRIPGALGITAFLAIAVAIAVQGAFQTRANIAQTFDRQSKIHQAQVWIEELSRLQIDEENSVRGYSLTRDPFYKDQYATAAANFVAKERRLRGALHAEQLSAAANTLDDYASLQTNWHRKIAEPQLARPGTDIAAIDKENKAFSDYEDRTTQSIRSTLADTSDALGKAAEEELNRSLVGRVFWLLVFGLLAILFNAFRTRSNRELEEERTITETLQRAFRSEHVPLPNADVGSAYLSASSHLAVGGDVFDVYRLSDNLALVLIADVSGKGVDAAVLTAFIKFTIRGIGLRRRDPGAMLAEFNTAFAQTVENPYLFVSMFVGVLDTETLILRYASAGHDSAFVRRSSVVQQLAVTGPVLGVMEEPFDTKALYLEDGDTIVLATDGLTEARNRSGEQLRESGAMELIGRSSRQPQLLADEIVAQVRALGGNRTRDDIAVLAIRVWERKSGGADA
ncbi:MAG: SpoIIE family protein phosphatase [Candidatus Eremiobacteraeota bacterium]|nr:SpoIIE family protein phosphatase [Candidatus Eremiobacteraeota bacterium]